MPGDHPFLWLGDRIVATADAAVRATDHGMTVGDGVFETLKLVGGRPFALRRHLARLARSATGLRLDGPDPALVVAAADAVIAANGLEEQTGAVLRITYTAGPGPLGSGRAATAIPTLVVASGPGRDWGRHADVRVVAWVRNERSAVAGLKTTSYAENVVALAEAARHGADEAIFANTRGRLCEGTGSNVFVGIKGALLTPPLSSGCLAGVTREIVLETGLAEEADLPLSALADADEAFLTSSTRDVHAVATIDGSRLPVAPGPLTAAAAAAFADVVRSSLDP